MKIKAAVLMLFVLVFCAVTAPGAAAGSVSLSALAGCRKLFSYSGENAAYFYGYDNGTLYSARVIPDVSVRYANVGGAILAACHDESRAYALCRGGTDSYFVLALDARSGEVSKTTLPGKTAPERGTFAVVGDELFVIYPGKVYDYAVGFTNGQSREYRFGANADRLFTNGGSAYALTDSGEIFRLGGGMATLCRTMPKGSGLGFYNAGCGWIYGKDIGLVSLYGSSVQRPGSRFAVMTDRGLFTHDGNALSAAAVGGTAAVLKSDYTCDIFDFVSEDGGEQPEKVSGLKSGEISVFPEGTTVARLKREFGVVSVSDSSGGSMDSGQLRTGCTAALGDGFCTIAVSGDINGSGTVNSADVTFVMKSFAEEKHLSGCEGKAADMDGNGSVDNRDLVLLAKECK